MDKKDIYEHLAKIYLGSTSIKKSKSKPQANEFRNFVLISAAIILGVLILVSSVQYKIKLPIPHSSLVLSADPVRVNYSLDPVKKQLYVFSLNKVNLKDYKTLAFSAKKFNKDDLISLRVEFVNSYNEKAEIYLNDVPANWKEFKIKLADFKTITNWTEMESLSFVIEEWNSKLDKGIIYIDNVRLVN